jgi:hypothetical protein
VRLVKVANQRCNRGIARVITPRTRISSGKHRAPAAQGELGVQVGTAVGTSSAPKRKPCGGEGDNVGELVGVFDGARVGRVDDGSMVGDWDGGDVVAWDGGKVSSAAFVGSRVGRDVGPCVGPRDGAGDDEFDCSSTVADVVGSWVGFNEGDAES